MKNPFEKYKLVCIKWADSFGVSSTWVEIGDDLPNEPHYCYSSGWLIKDGKHIKIIVPHLSPENEEIGARLTGCGDMSIPTSAIIEMKTLTF